MPRLLLLPGHPTCTPCDILHLCQSPMHRGRRGNLPGMANLRSLCLPTPSPSHLRTWCGQSSCSSCPARLPTPSSNFLPGGSGGQMRHCPSLRCRSQGGVEVAVEGRGLWRPQVASGLPRAALRLALTQQSYVHFALVYVSTISHLSLCTSLPRPPTS